MRCGRSRLHPTQLYSTIDGLILLLLLSAYYPLRRRDGEVMGLLMITYPITRFLIEHLRNDEGVFFAGLTISQNISLALLAGGLLFWFRLWRSPAGAFRRRSDGSRPRGCARGRLDGPLTGPRGSIAVPCRGQGTCRWSRIRPRMSSAPRPSASAS